MRGSRRSFRARASREREGQATSRAHDRPRRPHPRPCCCSPPPWRAGTDGRLYTEPFARARIVFGPYADVRTGAHAVRRSRELERRRKLAAVARWWRSPAGNTSTARSGPAATSSRRASRCRSCSPAHPGRRHAGVARRRRGATFGIFRRALKGTLPDAQHAARPARQRIMTKLRKGRGAARGTLLPRYLLLRDRQQRRRDPRTRAMRAMDTRLAAAWEHRASDRRSSRRTKR